MDAGLTLFTCEAADKREERRGNKSGGERARETPVPIPNTEVKPRNADDTVLETARESRWLPDFLFLISVLNV